MCRQHGEEPAKSYTGSFNVRLDPNTHKQLALYAKAHGESLNACVKHAVTQMLTN